MQLVEFGRRLKTKILNYVNWDEFLVFNTKCGTVLNLHWFFHQVRANGLLILNCWLLWYYKTSGSFSLLVLISSSFKRNLEFKKYMNTQVLLPTGWTTVSESGAQWQVIIKVPHVIIIMAKFSNKSNSWYYDHVWILSLAKLCPYKILIFKY